VPERALVAADRERPAVLRERVPPARLVDPERLDLALLERVLRFPLLDRVLPEPLLELDPLDPPLLACGMLPPFTNLTFECTLPSNWHRASKRLACRAP
jgi:hypothetical protein